MLRIATFVITFLFVLPSWVGAQTNLKIWYTAKYPYAFTDSSGQLRGLDVELIKKFVQYINKKESKKYTTSFTEYSNIKHLNTISHQLDSGDIILPDYFHEIDSTKFLRTNVFRNDTYYAISNKGFKPIEVFKNNNLFLFMQKRMIILLSEDAKSKWKNKWLNYTDSSTKYKISQNTDTIFDVLKSQEKFLIYLKASNYSKIKTKIEDNTTLHPLLNYSDNEAAFTLPMRSRFKDLLNYFLDKKTGYLSTNNYSLLYKTYFKDE